MAVSVNNSEGMGITASGIGPTKTISAKPDAAAKPEVLASAAKPKQNGFTSQPFSGGKSTQGQAKAPGGSIRQFTPPEPGSNPFSRPPEGNVRWAS